VDENVVDRFVVVGIVLVVFVVKFVVMFVMVLIKEGEIGNDFSLVFGGVSVQKFV
jgi:hypothetical protein